MVRGEVSIVNFRVGGQGGRYSSSSQGKTARARSEAWKWTKKGAILLI
jgi:hypothetical protein